MFIFTAKLSKRSLALTATAAALLICTLVGLTARPSPCPTAALTAAQSTRVRSNQDRIAYLEALGWQVAETPASVEEMKLPTEFDESYAPFLALQAEQGFDLTPLAGKRIKRYSYEILNHPSGEVGVLAHLLVHRSWIVGGEVLSPTIDGLHHGLTRP